MRARVVLAALLVACAHIPAADQTPKPKDPEAESEEGSWSGPLSTEGKESAAAESEDGEQKPLNPKCLGSQTIGSCDGPVICRQEGECEICRCREAMDRNSPNNQLRENVPEIEEFER